MKVVVEAVVPVVAGILRPFFRCETKIRECPSALRSPRGVELVVEKEAADVRVSSPVRPEEIIVNKPLRKRLCINNMYTYNWRRRFEATPNDD